MLGDAVYLVDQNENAQAVHLDDIKSTPIPCNQAPRPHTEEMDVTSPQSGSSGVQRTRRTFSEEVAEPTDTPISSQYNPPINIQNSSKAEETPRAIGRPTEDLDDSQPDAQQGRGIQRQSSTMD